MFTVNEDKKYAYEYYLKEKSGEEVRITKENYEAAYNAMASGGNALIAIGDNLYRTEYIVKLFIVKTRRYN